MASHHPIWLNLVPPARAQPTDEDMWPILRFISRLVRAIVPCGPRGGRRTVGPADDGATASLLQHQCVPPSPETSASPPVVIEVEPLTPQVQQPREETISKVEYYEMKHHLEGIIKDLEDEMMILQAHVAGSLDTPRDAAFQQMTISTPMASDLNLTPRSKDMVDKVAARCPVPETHTTPPPPPSASAAAEAADAAEEECDRSPAGSDTSQANSPGVPVSPSAHWISPAAERGSHTSTSTGVEMPRIPLSEVKSQWAAFEQKASGDMSHITPQQVPSFSLSSENDSPVVIGMPNTVSKYKETSSVRVHSTPFELRVDRTLSEMERYTNMARAATSSPDEQGTLP